MTSSARSMDEEDDWEGEDAGEEGGRLVTNNPVGEYYGGRNDKNERHGRGRAEMPNGDVYLGCYFRGKRHGLGVYRYKNGNGGRYGGDWYLGVKTGWGTMYFPDASQYTGCWYLGKIHGWGVYIYPNGDEYEGWWYMGQKNGQGIYRTKKTGEKFVGNWVLGLRQGKGMLIRKEHRFIGNWYNDCPKGPGVYIFPDLGVEQHGFYTMIKLNQETPESVTKYKNLGYQVLNIRKEPPMRNPSELEDETRLALSDEMSKMIGEGEDGATGDAGESAVANPSKKKKVDIMAKTPQQEFEEKLAGRMQEIIDGDLKTEAENQMPVAPMWRVIKITSLQTPYLDETVPPPSPLPVTPLPLEEPPDDDDLDKGKEDETICKDNEEEEAKALILAREHAVGDPYTGSGTCQLNLSNINWPDDCPPALRCSQMSFSNLDDLKNIVQSVLDKPLEPLDFEKIVAQNLHLFKGQGLDVSDRLKDCLGSETECGKNLEEESKKSPEKKSSKEKAAAAPPPAAPQEKRPRPTKDSEAVKVEALVTEKDEDEEE